MNYRFCRQWILGTLSGFFLSLCLFEVGEKPDIGALEGIIGGAAIGLAQWLVIRQHISQPSWWVLANIVSWGLLGGTGLGALGWVVPKNVLPLPLRLLYGAIGGVQVGALLGLGQWLALRDEIPKAWRWIGISAASWAIGLAVGWVVGGVWRSRTGIFLGEVVGLTLGWVIVATLTGFALSVLLPYSMPDYKLSHSKLKIERLK